MRLMPFTRRSPIGGYCISFLSQSIEARNDSRIVPMSGLSVRAVIRFVLLNSILSGLPTDFNFRLSLRRGRSRSARSSSDIRCSTWFRVVERVSQSVVMLGVKGTVCAKVENSFFVLSKVS